MNKTPACTAALPVAGEREAFEATIGAGRVLVLDAQGSYVSCYVQNDWEVWQARAALAPTPPQQATPSAAASIPAPVAQQGEPKLRKEYNVRKGVGYWVVTDEEEYQSAPLWARRIIHIEE